MPSSYYLCLGGFYDTVSLSVIFSWLLLFLSSCLFSIKCSNGSICSSTERKRLVCGGDASKDDSFKAILQFIVIMKSIHRINIHPFRMIWMFLSTRQIIVTVSVNTSRGNLMVLMSHNGDKDTHFFSRYMHELHTVAILFSIC